MHRLLLLKFAGCWLFLTASSVAGDAPIELKLNLQAGDIRELNLQGDWRSTRMAGDTLQEFTQSLRHGIRCEVEEVDRAGNHTCKLSYTDGKITGDDPVAGIVTPGGAVRMKISSAGVLSEISTIGKQDSRPLDDESRQGHLGYFFLASGKPVAVGDSWPLAEFKSGLAVTFVVVPGRDQELQAAYTLRGRANGEAHVTLSGGFTRKGKPCGTLTGSFVIDERSGWPKSGEITVKQFESPPQTATHYQHVVRIVEPKNQQ